ncbi:dihydrolipoamide acetyltransferase family protein [Micromonospora aurantiaca]|uniref:Dihydrolipoamide acetyltransferase component of pyruvate dehydrogenase complex n=1 Tax=Micromonospora aurantiaca (nom. illeg.) TaxID=47850 RepID=A0ABQ6UG98_9ACTN|nr:dihydrolipoamide acetyltransferase family protein [Micromonospora aurantiaca]KAB1112659.1 2-oxo acid dehydrogenase subunit E2 [Micromonospora aurantiaca]UFN93577.1 2-oxo acid dehydrogenase subunit E2 [Micromonospora aurantiaca]
MSVQQFRLPDVGEGLTEAEIVTWRVAPGDPVGLNDVIVDIETAKAVVELPSPYAGVVDRLLAEEGQTVEVGAPIIAIRTGGDPVATDAAPAVAPPPADEPAVERTAVLVGYGVSAQARTRRPRRATPSVRPAEPARPAHTSRPPVLTKPPLRKLAKDLGVELADVRGSGPDGRITRQDLLDHTTGPAPVADQRRDERLPVRGVRKATAAAMVASAFTAPHVTEFLTVDMTGTVEFVDRLKQDPAFQGVKVSPLLVASLAVLDAVRRYPDVNARWDEENQEIVRFADVNLGIAAATPRGLLVPNVKAAQNLPVRDLAVALNELASTAREGRTRPADLSGGTITITNIGVFGVDAGTPILNPGEAAILCLGALRRMPWVVDEQVVPRWTVQLSLSFDHRLVDGELGSRVLAHVGRFLEDPLWGLALR